MHKPDPVLFGKVGGTVGIPVIGGLVGFGGLGGLVGFGSIEKKKGKKKRNRKKRKEEEEEQNGVGNHLKTNSIKTSHLNKGVLKGSYLYTRYSSHKCEDIPFPS